jgi:hypothetical protein
MEVAGILELAFHLGDAVHASHRLADAALPTDVDAQAPTLPSPRGGGKRFLASSKVGEKEIKLMLGSWWPR